VIAWAVLLLLICVQSWWAMFELRHYQPWTFAAFAVVLLQTILTYMLAGLVFPDLFGEGNHFTNSLKSPACSCVSITLPASS
jgi:hypothetical protein